MVFTEDEQVVIRSLNPDIKYLARDMDGSLYGHSEKPLKQAAAWESIGNIYDLTPFTNVFQGITWKDKEPTYIRTGGTPAIFGKWTNVDDGLPGHDGLYIVSVVPAVNGKPTGEFFPESCIVSEYSVIKGWEIEQCETLEEPPKVTHWMPAPLPPEYENLGFNEIFVPVVPKGQEREGCFHIENLMPPGVYAKERMQEDMQKLIPLFPGGELKVFDWDRAVSIIKKHKIKNAAAGLSEDWNNTCGMILEDNSICKSHALYLASTWDTPVVVDNDTGDEYECFVMEHETDWNAHTVWPASAVKKLKEGR